MLAMITLIFILIAAINVVNAIQTDNRLSTAMDELIQYVERTRILRVQRDSETEEGDDLEHAEDAAEKTSMFDKGKRGRHSALTQYSGRFFSVLLPNLLFMLSFPLMLKTE